MSSCQQQRLEGRRASLTATISGINGQARGLLQDELLEGRIFRLFKWLKRFFFLDSSVYRDWFWDAGSFFHRPRGWRTCIT